MTFDFKNATRAELRSEYDRIGKEMGDFQFFTKRELFHLPKILADTEQVLAFTSGLMDNNTWLIALTDRRIIFLDKGMIYGLKQAAIDLDKINAISGETAILFGTIKIEDGARERVIANVWKKTVVPFTNRVRDAIEARRRSRQAPAAIPTGDDRISRLERLAALRDKGVLTEAEFEEQKNAILNS
ncbi:MAG TPA: PH domain-containing protein [Spongiibacteraceae bacterium]|nr:PH domain-containing protein [Spongiibacteraceae bacterium]